jgi:hypothetical protein
LDAAPACERAVERIFGCLLQGVLEINRDQIKGRWWRRLFAARQEPAPIEAEFKEVAEVPKKPPKKTGKSVRLI